MKTILILILLTLTACKQSNNSDSLIGGVELKEYPKLKMSDLTETRYRIMAINGIALQPGHQNFTKYKFPLFKMSVNFINLGNDPDQVNLFLEQNGIGSDSWVESSISKVSYSFNGPQMDGIGIYTTANAQEVSLVGLNGETCVPTEALTCDFVVIDDLIFRKINGEFEQLWYLLNADIIE